MKTKHTKGQIFYLRFPGYVCLQKIFDNQDGLGKQYTPLFNPGNHIDQQEIDAQRIVSLWNDHEGIEDPATEIPRLRAEHAEMLAALKEIKKDVDRLDEARGWDSLCEVESVIARVKAKNET